MCPQCFEVNAAEATFCSLCGAAFGVKDGGDHEGSDAEVQKELALTNLHRMRGQYKEAVQVCLGILKRYPNNATAHTLLGDIYAEQGELAQAAEWYEMALDLKADSEADKEKLASVRRRMEEKEKAVTIEQIGVPTQAPRTGLYIAAAAGAIVLVGSLAYWAGSGMRVPSGGPQQASVTRPVNLPRNPPTPAGSGDQQNQSQPQPSAPVAPSADAAAASDDLAVLNLLKSQGSEGRRVIAVTEDPREPMVIVTALGADQVEPKRIAMQVAGDVFTNFPKYRRVVMRVVSGANVILIADVPKDKYEEVKGKLAANEDLADRHADVLGNVWSAAAAQARQNQTQAP